MNSKRYSAVVLEPPCTTWPPPWLAASTTALADVVSEIAAPDGWDAALAAAVVSECQTLIDAAGFLTPAQRGAADGILDAARRHAAQYDAALWQDADFLRDRLARWRAENAT